MRKAKDEKAKAAEAASAEAAPAGTVGAAPGTAAAAADSLQNASAASGDEPAASGAGERPTRDTRGHRGARAHRGGRPARSPRADGSSADAANAANADRPSRTDRSKRERKPLTPVGIALRVVFGVLVVALVAVIGGFSCFRWLLNDDASDFQGTWYVAGTDTPISISADAIALNGEVSYGYTLDASTKTVAFTFSDLSGAGHYRFSLDRQYLAIMDGSFGWWDTLSDDFGWTANALILSAQGQQASPAGAENVTLLSRTPASQTA